MKITKQINFHLFEMFLLDLFIHTHACPYSSKKHVNTHTYMWDYIVFQQYLFIRKASLLTSFAGGEVIFYDDWNGGGPSLFMTHLADFTFWYCNNGGGVPSRFMTAEMGVAFYDGHSIFPPPFHPYFGYETSP